MLWSGISDGIRNVDRGGPGSNCRLHHATEKVRLGTSGIFGRKFDIRTIPGRPLYACNCTADDLLFVHLQLELAMDRTGCQKDVNSRLCSGLKGLPGAINIGITTPGQTTDDRAADLTGNFPNCFKISWRGNWKSRFDHIDPEICKHAGNFQFFSQIHAGARRLFSIAKRRVKNTYLARFICCHEKSFLVVLSGSLPGIGHVGQWPHPASASRGCIAGVEPPA